MAHYSEGYGTVNEGPYEVLWLGIDLSPFCETGLYMEEYEVLGNIYENPELLQS